MGILLKKKARGFHGIYSFFFSHTNKKKSPKVDTPQEHTTTTEADPCARISQAAGVGLSHQLVTATMLYHWSSKWCGGRAMRPLQTPRYIKYKAAVRWCVLVLEWLVETSATDHRIERVTGCVCVALCRCWWAPGLSLLYTLSPHLVDQSLSEGPQLSSRTGLAAQRTQQSGTYTPQLVSLS